MRPAHVLLALVAMAGLVAGGLLLFGSSRAGRSDAPVTSGAADRGSLPSPVAHEPAENQRAAPLVEPATAEPGGSSSEPRLAPEARAEAGTIRGRVVGAPPEVLATLEVQATALDAREPARLARCDAEGRFVLADLPPSATFHLRGVVAGRASYGRSRTEVRTARTDEAEVELAWLPDPALLFQVTNARTGLALTDFEVRLGRGFARPLLDEEGRIRRSFPEGRVRWVGWAPEETREPVELVVSARGYQELRLGALLAPLSGDLDLGRLGLEPAPRLVVLVLEEATRLPVQGALVSLRHAGATVPSAAQVFDPHSGRTDAAGFVTLTRLPGENGVLAVQHAGHVDLEQPIVLTLAEEQRETVSLAPRP